MHKKQCLNLPRMPDVLRLEGAPLSHWSDPGNWNKRVLPGGAQGHTHYQPGGNLNMVTSLKVKQQLFGLET